MLSPAHMGPEESLLLVELLVLVEEQMKPKPAQSHPFASIMAQCHFS